MRNKSARFHIVSFRINDEDKKILQKISNEAKLSTSELLRRAFLALTLEYGEEAEYGMPGHLGRGVWRDPEAGFYSYLRNAEQIHALRWEAAQLPGE